jgi:quinol monooxygenase YgiN
MKHASSLLLPICTLLLLSAVFAFPAAAQDKENPIAKEVAANLKNPSKPFTMVVRVKIKDGAAGKFEAAFAKALAATRKEKGFKAYDLNRSVKTPTEYFVYERWQNLAALQAHLKTPHITALLAEIGDLLEAPPEVKVFMPAGE